jgi:putative ABC transport system ATP-binding protein
MELVLDVRNLYHTFIFEFQRQDVLTSVDLHVKPGEFVILTGPSGCGKTTLLTLISGLRAIQRGSIKLLGNELFNADAATRLQLRALIGMVYQSHHLIDFLTAEENIILAMDPSVRAERDMLVKQRRARNLLKQLGLEHKTHARPAQLSGGQRQRVAIARAMACRPKLLIADEPTASLDAENSGLIMQLFRELVDTDGLSVLMTSHDQRLHRYADRIVKISDGRIIPD